MRVSPDPSMTSPAASRADLARAAGDLGDPVAGDERFARIKVVALAVPDHNVPDEIGGHGAFSASLPSLRAAAVMLGG